MSSQRLTMQWSQGDEDNNCDGAASSPLPSSLSPLSTSDDDGAVLDKIRTMRDQEDGPYRTANYFASLRRRTKKGGGRRSKKGGSSKAASTTTEDDDDCIDEECRVKMTRWAYQVVDHCKIDRETVSIAASYLDRYLLTDGGGRAALRDRRSFQLVAMTALYVSLKLFEDVSVEPKVMAGLSRGGYAEDEFTAMELEMLMALRWHVHPPTAKSFLVHFLRLFPRDDERNHRNRRHRGHRHRIRGSRAEAEEEDLIVELYDCAKYQAELAVNDPKLIGTEPSVIAFAALLNAMEAVFPLDSTSRLCDGVTRARAAFLLHRVEEATSINAHSPSVLKAKERLQKLSDRECHDFAGDRAASGVSFSETTKDQDGVEAELRKKESCGELSPRCASFGL